MRFGLVGSVETRNFWSGYLWCRGGSKGGLEGDWIGNWHRCMLGVALCPRWSMRWRIVGSLWGRRGGCEGGAGI